MSYLGFAFKSNLECKFIMMVTSYIMFKLGYSARSNSQKQFSEALFSSSCNIEWLPPAKYNPALFLSELRGASSSANCIQNFL